MTEFNHRNRSCPMAIRRAEWLDSVRSACLTLGRTPESLISSLCLLTQISGPVCADRSWSQLARRVAEEFGVVAEVQLDGNCLTVRLRRDPKCTIYKAPARTRGAGAPRRWPGWLRELRPGWELIKGVRPGNHFYRIRRGQKR